MTEEIYREKKIEVKEENNKKKLFVDGKEIEIFLDARSGTFSCQGLPYARYSSLEELGRALIDNG